MQQFAMATGSAPGSAEDTLPSPAHHRSPEVKEKADHVRKLMRRNTSADTEWHQQKTQSANMILDELWADAEDDPTPADPADLPEPSGPQQSGSQPVDVEPDSQLFFETPSCLLEHMERDGSKRKRQEMMESRACSMRSPQPRTRTREP